MKKCAKKKEKRSKGVVCVKRCLCNAESPFLFLKEEESLLIASLLFERGEEEEDG